MGQDLNMDQGVQYEANAPFLEAGRLLFSAPCGFTMGVAALSQLPESKLQEIAFAGRSNVGKSSLINALVGQKALARTSNTPGRTQQLNFFLLGGEADPKLYLVDLPGYGYAKVSKSQVEAWTDLLKAYLRGRPRLRRVFVLVDSRHGLKDSDREIMRMMDEAAVSYQIVLTKADKLKAGARQKLLEAVLAEAKKFVACHPEVILTSSIKKDGLDELRAVVAGLLAS